MPRVRPPVLRVFTPQEMGRYTRLLRKLLGIHDQKSPDILDIFERLKQIFPRLRIRIVADADLPGAEARAYPALWIIKIRKGIYEGLLRGDAGARWTFAHELGHVLLQHPGSPHRRRSAPQDVIERQAHMFAAQLLAPSDLVRKFKLPENVASAFQLSSKAARHRLWEVKLEDRGRQFDSEIPEDSEQANSSALEYLASIACPQLSNTLDRARVTFPTLQPWKDNLLCTSLLISTAHQLLLDAYESTRQKPANNKFIRAAIMVTAIHAISPIREFGSHDLPPKVLLEINSIFALNAATSFLGIPSDQFAANPKIGIDADIVPPCCYLSGLIQSFEVSVLNASTILHLGDMPTYRDYCEGDDITWREILGIERLARYLSLLAGSAGITLTVH
ncbi:ImmA/IrrE family metallo-endopeptidase [Bradyrhizobium guangzhouense]|uniref:ImmA/IrrE family metallo-endopeptidase n=1 Tax=Bradyrhizobium guangzhouense TaxID=1325095 RepID=UPI001009BF23|nr:ImmA/IrrE family metallo-endopeptidase [Bradyrhizobium guangzhouense]RXH14736.1 ImmA/IrrE family metallo-endopeptidase [Bradyrhizobium guangzhouense]